VPLAAWQIGDLGPQRLTAGSVALEKDLEDWIERDPRLLDAGLTVVNRQMNLGGVGKLDLLCVDPQGRATVVEIKRGPLIRDTIAQALDYASAIAMMPADDLKARVVDYMGSDAAANPAVAALFDTSDGSRREVAVIVVGVGQDAAVDRMIDYLGGAFGMPIRAVTFDVFSLGGAQVLVREETESEPAPTATPDGLPTNNREAVIARAGGPSSPNGQRMMLIAAAAERNGLYVRPYRRSLMITPPQNKTRFLMNMWTWTGKPDELVISYGADAFAEFFPVPADKVAAIFGPNADAAPIETDDDAVHWESSLDRLFVLINEDKHTASGPDDGSAAVSGVTQA
jgi:hypothetical protein